MSESRSEPSAADCPAFMEKVLEPAFVLTPDSTLRPQLVTGATVHEERRSP